MQSNAVDNRPLDLGPCAGDDGDFIFEKNGVKITSAEEFTFVRFVKNARSRTNGWKTADYKDSKRRAIALGIMHILRPQRTTYVNAWQIGFFERALKREQIYWAKIFHDLILINAYT